MAYLEPGSTCGPLQKEAFPVAPENSRNIQGDQNGNQTGKTERLKGRFALVASESSTIAPCKSLFWGDNPKKMQGVLLVSLKSHQKELPSKTDTPTGPNQKRASPKRQPRVKQRPTSGASHSTVVALPKLCVRDVLQLKPTSRVGPTSRCPAGGKKGHPSFAWFTLKGNPSRGKKGTTRQLGFEVCVCACVLILEGFEEKSKGQTLLLLFYVLTELLVAPKGSLFKAKCGYPELRNGPLPI